MLQNPLPIFPKIFTGFVVVYKDIFYKFICRHGSGTDCTEKVNNYSDCNAIVTVADEVLCIVNILLLLESPGR